ncbi:response regulator, partial [Oxalobacteraceae bacterium OM1]
IGGGDVRIDMASGGREALESMHKTHYDCVVVDPALPEGEALELVEKIGNEPELGQPPVVLEAAHELPPADKLRVESLSERVPVRVAASPAQLLAETALFLHRPYGSMAESQQRSLDDKSDVLLAGRKVLIVDDDVRNIFALSSALVREDMKVLYAENGRDGIEVLQSNPSVDIVLMDIMMPEMDGYDTMRAIRAIPQFASLPIITLTAKAMKGDRDKCIAAGASDYITKPVDMTKLLSMMRVWLHRG